MQHHVLVYILKKSSLIPNLQSLTDLEATAHCNKQKTSYSMFFLQKYIILKIEA